MREFPKQTKKKNMVGCFIFQILLKVFVKYITPLGTQ